MIKKTIKKLVLEVGTLNRSNKEIAQLIKVEGAFKRAYRVDAEVKYVDAKYRNYIRPNVRGYHSGKNNMIVVFVDGNTRRNAETLLHELTHAYQNKYMHKQLKKSKMLLNNNMVTYRDAWHEEHARHCAKLLINTFDFSLDLNNAMDYIIAA